ncbi:MAG: hypothetical protein GKR88_13915 [Flavobacteriaceae bacterium]|nr:MAG: hypothetical protein GKR88_13915 [Flavobacteriaceae bacterium]
MKRKKSRFRYNKRQRNGIFYLFLLIVIFQVVYITVDFSKETSHTSDDLAFFEKQFDSLKALNTKTSTPKIYPFNPNYINDYKGYQLGMTVSEIDKLLAYRQSGKFINSAREFQQITKISDSLLKKIAPYFKFPEWVMKRNQKLHHERKKQVTGKTEVAHYKEKYKITTTDINKAIALDFQTIKGIGEKLSERIIKYRNKLQGFTYEDQLFEVWGLDKKLAKQILTVFNINEKPVIRKINVNTATFKEVLSIPYINYDLCKKIFEFRDEVAELQDIEELKNIEGLPVEKYHRIVLYLLAQ